MGWSRISFTNVGAGKLLLAKSSHELSNWIKKFLVFSFCKCLWLVDLRICFYQKRARPWLWFRIKFNWYRVRFFQRALVGFNKLWIQFIFRELNWVSMSKRPRPIVQVESWNRCLGGCTFPCSRGNRTFFFSIFWNSTNLAYVTDFGLEGLVYDYLFTFQRESHSVPYMDFFTIPSLILSHLELSRIELPKLTPSILMKIVQSLEFLKSLFLS